MQKVSHQHIDDDSPQGADWVAPDCEGLNFFEIDKGLQEGLALYLDEPLRELLLPQLHRLGQVAGAELDRLARIADRHPPILPNHI